MGRRVPVPAVGGVPGDRCYDAAPMAVLVRPDPHADHPGLPRPPSESPCSPPGSCRSRTRSRPIRWRPRRRRRSDRRCRRRPRPLITLPPIGSGGPPTPSPSHPGRSASRRGSASPPSRSTCPSSASPTSSYPACNVAMYYQDRASANPARAARRTCTPTPGRGCSCRSCTQSKVSNGKKMLGMVVEVWTNDDQRFLYVITEVSAARPDAERLRRARSRATTRAALAADLGGRRAAAEAPGRRPSSSPRRPPTTRRRTRSQAGAQVAA